MITKPRPRRAQQITQTEADVHHWLGRLAMCLAISSHDLPPHMQKHVRKTIDEFVASNASSETLAGYVRDEMKR